MGGLFGGGSGSGSGSTSAKIVAGGYPDDGAKPFPTSASDTAVKRIRQTLQARSGRTSTNLAGDAGTRPYFAQFLGNTG
jgi:hypothetical protein